MRTFLSIAFTLILSSTIKAQDIPSDQSLRKELEPFRALIGKTLKGEFESVEGKAPVVDVMKWERAMNGQAIRCLHSINDGAYGGETIFMWDPKQDAVAFWYFTTGGFYTQGTIELNKSGWSSLEEVTGNEGGISKVRASSTLTTDGGLKVETSNFANGKWEPGHSVVYKLAPDVKVIFR